MKFNTNLSSFIKKHKNKKNQIIFSKSTYKNKKSCNLTLIGCTSFFPSKPLGCYGDGGACFTNNKDLYKQMKGIRLHGQVEGKGPRHKRIGINGLKESTQKRKFIKQV